MTRKEKILKVLKDNSCDAFMHYMRRNEDKDPAFWNELAEKIEKEINEDENFKDGNMFDINKC